MKCSMSPETWARDRDAFVFRCHHPLKGDRWTFLVERSTLEVLAADEPLQPTTAFDKLRLSIYAAAFSRMEYADPKVQQMITVEDIRNVS
jgi:hypothetical protein